MTHPTLTKVTDRVIARSKETRASYLADIDAMKSEGRVRSGLACGNLAHGFAACGDDDKEKLKGDDTLNIGIVTAFNDMLSAHQPYEPYPAMIKDHARSLGATAQVASGVPAMCDGVTQGQVGMELSLFSRDVIAMSTAIALSHNMFDSALCLGICDKIVPGQIIGALQFGHLPVCFVPAGPMESGLPNKEKVRIREEYAKGNIGRKELLEAESASYHSPGTCTFYGTANSNQMLMEIMGVQLPGSSFVNPGTKLRDALTREVVKRSVELVDEDLSIGHIIDEKAIVNAIVGLLATGGSTNHTLHIIAIAKAAGININWDDFSELSDVVPLLCRVYPNGSADVNHFHAAGGMPLLIRMLLDAGLMHEDVNTILGHGMRAFTKEPKMESDGSISWHDAPEMSGDAEIIGTVENPFSKDGGISLLQGNLGRAVMKTSAVKPEYQSITAPAKVFTSQASLQQAFQDGKLQGDFVAVVIGQGPRANGMPELHKLTPPLGILQDMGFRVALVTDGRMSGASGKVPAAIHVSPESSAGGEIGKVRDGDMIHLDVATGALEARVDAAEWAKREILKPVAENDIGRLAGRNLFASARANCTAAEEGASFILGDGGTT